MDMRKPFELSTRGLEVGYRAKLRPVIVKRLARLEHLLEGIIGCRVVVERPQHGHRSHNPFSVKLSLMVPPSAHLVVSHVQPDPDASAVEVLQAAFDKMERQLADFAERRRNDVKEHTRTGAFARD